MRLLVCGGRNFGQAYQEDVFIRRWIAEILTTSKDGFNKGNHVIISGGARGADTIASNYARDMGIVSEVYMADWDKYGNMAGPRRNREMLVKGRPDLVLAFPGGPGTANMIQQATVNGYRVKQVLYP